jgi:large subunit ribosomal protein L14e
VAGKFAASSWGKKMARQAAKKSLGDFGRWQAMKAKVAKSAAVKAKL